MPVLSYEGMSPVVDPTAFLAPSAWVIGDVRVGAGASLWFAVTARGDRGHIEIGEDVNVQDGCTLHSQGRSTVVLEDRVALGHHALVHGALVQSDCLIAIGASVLSGARVGQGSIVAAHALVPEGMVVPPGSLVMGVPGRVVRQVTDEERARVSDTIDTYRGLRGQYLGRVGRGEP
jgi:carbonic anhydrase/acetyltransferase-like protein (isoleucine patch superfamily)